MIKWLKLFSPSPPIIESRKALVIVVMFPATEHYFGYFIIWPKVNLAPTKGVVERNQNFHQKSLKYK